VIITISETSSGLLSAVFILLACISWGIDNHLSAVIDGVSPQTLTFIKGLFGGLTNLVIGMFLNNWQVQLHYIPLALVIGVFSYGFSIVLYVSSAQNLGATRSQILFSTAPFWGILAAWILLGETINVIVIASFIILTCGILLTNLSSHVHTHTHRRMVHIHMHTHNDGHHDHVHQEEVELDTRHSHVHEHKEYSHTHKHFPDIHHRHTH
jgi:drug/metabolite transporter (DMT)-like permease